MALRDEAAREVVIVVAFVGPGGSGKQTTLQGLYRLAEAAGCRLGTWRQDGQLVGFDYWPQPERRRGDDGVRLMLRTLTGPVGWTSGSEDLQSVLEAADALVVTVDPTQLPHLRTLQTHLQLRLRDFDRWPLIVQVNKVVTGNAPTVPAFKQAPRLATDALSGEGLEALRATVETDLLDRALRNLRNPPAPSPEVQPDLGLSALFATVTAHPPAVEPASKRAAVLKQARSALDERKPEAALALLAGMHGSTEARRLRLEAFTQAGQEAELRTELDAAVTEWTQPGQAVSAEDFESLLACAKRLADVRLTKRIENALDRLRSTDAL